MDSERNGRGQLKEKVVSTLPKILSGDMLGRIFGLYIDTYIICIRECNLKIYERKI